MDEMLLSPFYSHCNYSMYNLLIYSTYFFLSPKDMNTKKVYLMVSVK